MRVFLLGGYGLIGKEIGQALLKAGHHVVAAARNPDLGARLLPAATWHKVDLNNLMKSEDWVPFLRDCDAVINAAGALQSGGGDRLSLSQRDSLIGLVRACEQQGVQRFVQISAPGASADAETEFLRTKGEADNALAASRLDWVILKPGLVLAPTAFGGTALLRMLAAVPWIQPLLLGKARFQCVEAKEVAAAVLSCLEDPTLARQSYDLMEAQSHSLESLVLAIRQWLGFPTPKAVLTLPLPLGFALARLADLAAVFGWRSPLRSTALKVMAKDVVGDPGPWERASGQRMKALPEILAELPSSRQERIFSRHLLVFPLGVLTLSAFWLLSGLLALLEAERASLVLASVVTSRQALLFVYTGAFLDLAIGAALLYRPWFRLGCLSSIAVSLTYLLLASILVPALWLDPLGPLVKVFPGILLALYLAMLAEER